MGQPITVAAYMSKQDVLDMIGWSKQELQDHAKERAETFELAERYQELRGYYRASIANAGKAQDWRHVERMAHGPYDGDSLLTALCRVGWQL